MSTHAPTPLTEFAAYGKTPRLFRDCIITEKLDGSNAQISIDEYGNVRAGSRTRWCKAWPASEDNYGFASWCDSNQEELLKLGPGRHFGEWYGRGINRGYGLTSRRFALFNVSRWEDGALSPKTFQRGVEQPRVALSPRPACCEVVPVIFKGLFDTALVQRALMRLEANGSYAAPGYRNPEGVVVFHCAANQVFKVLLENDQNPKGE